MQSHPKPVNEIVNGSEAGHTHAGDTPLHEIARYCSSFSDFESKTSALDEKTRTEYALFPNDAGGLPLDVINSNLSELEKKLIYSRLLEFALAKKVKPLHELVNFEDLIATYQLKPETLLYSHFKYACELVNETRKHILNKTSQTHPHINGIDIEERQKIARKVNVRRNKDAHTPKKLLLQTAFFEKTSYKRELSQEEFQITLDLSDLAYEHLYAAYDKDVEIYNCEEMARYTYYLGKTKGLNITPYHYTKPKGDHVFTIIGDQVMCDSWSGNVSLKSEHQFFGDYRKCVSQGKAYNLITQFNPNYHTLEKTFFPAQCMVYTFRLNSDSPIEKLLSEVVQQLSSAKETFLFLDIIKHNLKLALEKNLISEKTILSWTDPTRTLKEYFSYDDRYLPLLTELYSEDEKFFLKKLTKAITKHSVNPNQADIYCMTALYVAAANNYQLIVDFLLKNKANPNKAIMPNWETPLFIAAQEGYEAVVDMLLKCHNIKFRSVKNSKENFINFAKNKSVEIQERMEKHIENKRKKGEPEYLISISPSRIARIVGNNEIAEKIEQAKEIKQEKKTKQAKHKTIKTNINRDININTTNTTFNTSVIRENTFTLFNSKESNNSKQGSNKSLFGDEKETKACCVLF